ncbi:MAG: response regulator transcription factor [Bacteroidetes bacterium]|nr:response regulator transcription factor [Bacteroidota bacterium]
MYKILIVEDEQIVAKDLANTLKRHGCTITGIAKTAQDALDLFKAKKPDLVFIDIELKGKETGIDVANYILKKDRVPFIFLSQFNAANHKEYYTNAKETKPFNYIPKANFSDGQLWHFVEMALDDFARENDLVIDGYKNAFVLRGHIFLKTDGKQIFDRIAINAIKYIETERPLVRLYTDEKSYVLAKSLLELVNSLKSNFITRISQSKAVNLQRIKKIASTSNTIIMDDGKIFEIGRAFKKEFLDKVTISS